jgi:hypothetical protein
LAGDDGFVKGILTLALNVRVEVVETVLDHPYGAG